MQVFLTCGPQSEWGAQTLFLNWPKTEGGVDLPSGLQVGWTCNDGSGSPANYQHLSSCVRLHLPAPPLAATPGRMRNANTGMSRGPLQASVPKEHNPGCEQRLASFSFSEYSLTLSTATMLVSISDDIRTSQFK